VDFGRFCFKGREDRRTGRTLERRRAGSRFCTLLLDLLRAPCLAIPVYISVFKIASKNAERKENGMVIGRGRALSEPVGARKSDRI
jgi:hypothetical protein